MSKAVEACLDACGFVDGWTWISGTDHPDFVLRKRENKLRKLLGSFFYCIIAHFDALPFIELATVIRKKIAV